MRNEKIRKINTQEVDTLNAILFPNFLPSFKGLEEDLFIPVYIHDKDNPLGYATEINNKGDGRIIVLSKHLFDIPNFKDKSEAIVFVLMHEILHHRLLHLKEFKHYLERNQLLANIAMDLIINETILEIMEGKGEFKITEDVWTFRNFESKRKENVLGFKVKPTLDVELMKKMDDAELLEYLFGLLEPTFNQVMNFIDQEFSSCENNNSSNNNNSSSNDNSSDEENSSSQENSSSDEKENNSSGEENNSSDEENSNSSSNVDEEVEEKLSEIFQKAQEITRRVIRNIQDEMRKNNKFREDIGNIGQFGDLAGSIYEEVLKRLLRENGLLPDDENSDLKETISREKLKDFLKHQGKAGSGLRNFVFSKEKMKIPTLVNKIFNFLTKGGYIKKKVSYPNKKVRTSSILHPKRSYEGTHLSVIVDTSGSISDGEMQKFVKILNALISQGVILDIYFNDTEYEEHRNIDSKKKLEKILNDGFKGGGGSVFDEVFRRNKQNFGILLTDLYISGLEYLPKGFVVILTDNFDNNQASSLKNPKFKLSDLE